MSTHAMSTHALSTYATSTRATSSTNPAHLSTVIVLGGSVAGLLAAAASARHTTRVVVVERDELPPWPGPRPGAPQTLHTHGLLASGREAMEHLLPGLTDDLVAQGALTGDIGTNGIWHVGGHRVAQVAAGGEGLLVSRALLEAYLRVRVRGLPNVTVLDRTDVRGLLSDRPGAVNGVLLADRDDPTAPEEFLDADLVVDATGRPGRAQRWFAAHGWLVPDEERVVVGIRYVTVHVPHQEGKLDDARAVISAATPSTPRSAAALRQEDGTWTVTVAGYVEDEPPLDPAGLRAYAATVVAPEIAALLDRELLGQPLPYRFPHSVRRRVDRTDLPEGYAVLGDALCSLNPVFGQGMSVAAMQAVTLGEALAGTGPAGLESALRTFHQEAVAAADRAWTLVAGSDLQIAGVHGTVPRGHKAISAWVARVQAAAAYDPVVARALIRVTSLLDPPESLMRPRMVLRVLTRSTVKAGAIDSAVAMSSASGESRVGPPPGRSARPDR